MAGTSFRPPVARLPSLSQYVMVFFLLIVMALAAFAAMLWQDLGALMTRVAASDTRLAAQELEAAQHALQDRVEALAAALEEWDEARAQLEDPTYYLYWRDNRATSAAEVLPVLPTDLELYDAEGRALAQEPRGGLPMRLRAEHARPWLDSDGRRVWAHFVAPLRDPDSAKLMGHVAVRFLLPEILQQVHDFHHLDTNSLSITLPAGTRVAYDDLPHHTALIARPNPYAETLTDLARRAAWQLAVGAALVLLITYLLVNRLALMPIRRLVAHLDNLKAGRASLLAAGNTPLPVRELEALRETLNDYQLRLEELHGDLASKNSELWRMAHHDPLTGVFNRRALEDDWRQMLATRGPAALPVSLSLFDCDHFKAINDTYGHHVGDEVIQALARCLRGSLRASDRLYRLGGDEFATVLWNTPAEEAAQLAQRCLDAVEAYDFTVHGVRGPVRVSAGIAEARALGDDTREELQRRADVAMYQAKRPGASKIVLYSEALDGQQVLVSHPETHAVWAAMRDRERLILHYQPVLDLSPRRLSHYEALLRIRDGDRLVMPSVIFPLVEMRGCECELDLAVITRLETELGKGCIPAGTGVAVNVSGPGIVDARVVERLLGLARFLPQHRLILEVTETSLITRITEASGHLARLRAAGFAIALDDFGNGYSSLRYLAHMPVDYVKFDRDLVHALTGRDRQATLVRDLARLIRDAGYRLVAEGIESEDMLAAAADVGFDQAQGYHLGRPQALA